jgi:NTE family protein
VQFSDLKIPFACVATDIMTGGEVVMNHGSVLEAVRASISIPGIFTPVNHEGRYLVDGGLVNPVPISVLKNMGAEFIIAVNVIPDISIDNRSYWTGKKGSKEFRELNIFDVLMQSIYIGIHALAKTATNDADVVIEPQVAYISPGDFPRARECILQGELAIQDVILKLKRQLAAAAII